MQDKGVLMVASLAGLCFLGSFFFPFLCSDFHLNMPVLDDIDKPCERIGPRIIDMSKNALEDVSKPATAIIPWDTAKSTTTSLCKKHAEETIHGFTSDLLQDNLGSMKELSTGKEMTWSQCLTKMQKPKNRKFSGSCCTPAKSATEACLKLWLAKDMGIGEKKITEIVAELFAKKSYALGIVIVFFSIIFPLLKIFLTFVLSFNTANNQLRSLLNKVSKWSMADVFIASLSIVFFKSESLGFAFTPQEGLYLFTIGAILSSVALMLIPKKIIPTYDDDDDFDDFDI